MYIFKKEINKNCELSCDEAVVKSLNGDYRSYGDALIATITETKHNASAAASMSSDGRFLKKRLEAIMNRNTKKTLKYLSRLLLRCWFARW